MGKIKDFLFKDQKRNKVICTLMPDGENYFQGIHEVRMPMKSGGFMPIMTNLWTPHFEDLADNAGIFTLEEAEYYVTVIAMDGVFIRTHEDELKARTKLLN